MSVNPFSTQRNGGGPVRDQSNGNKPGLSRQVSNCTRDIRSIKRENEELQNKVANLEKEIE